MFLRALYQIPRIRHHAKPNGENVESGGYEPKQEGGERIGAHLRYALVSHQYLMRVDDGFQRLTLYVERILRVARERLRQKQGSDRHANSREYQPTKNTTYGY